MTINHYKDGQTIVITLDGELGHYEARSIMDYIENIIDLYPSCHLALDFGRLVFMDSSGIAVVMNAYRNCKNLNRSFCVINAPTFAMKIFNAAAITKIINFNEKVG